MHRKQYQAMAQIFAGYNSEGEQLTSLYYGDREVGALMTDLIKYFKIENPHFDEVKFAKACIPNLYQR